MLKLVLLHFKGGRFARAVGFVLVEYKSRCLLEELYIVKCFFHRIVPTQDQGHIIYIAGALDHRPANS